MRDYTTAGGFPNAVVDVWSGQTGDLDLAELPEQLGRAVVWRDIRGGTGLPRSIAEIISATEEYFGVEADPWLRRSSSYREPRPGDRLASIASQLFGTQVYSAPLIAEGGAFVVDGAGVVFTSKSCLLHKKRNPNVNQSEIEQALIDLGASKVIWLEGDEHEAITNGHVDGYVLPAESGDVLVQRADHGHNASARSADILSIHSALLQTRAKASVVLILPPRNLKTSNSMFAGSYLNVHAPNNSVIVPTFGDETRDLEAQQAIREAFLGREIVEVNINSLASGGGGIRCLVQPVPAKE